MALCEHASQHVCARTHPPEGNVTRSIVLLASRLLRQGTQEQSHYPRMHKTLWPQYAPNQTCARPCTPPACLRPHARNTQYPTGILGMHVARKRNCANVARCMHAPTVDLRHACAATCSQHMCFAIDLCTRSRHNQLGSWINIRWVFIPFVCTSMHGLDFFPELEAGESKVFQQCTTKALLHAQSCPLLLHFMLLISSPMPPNEGGRKVTPKFHGLSRQQGTCSAWLLSPLP